MSPLASGMAGLPVRALRPVRLPVAREQVAERERPRIGPAVQVVVPLDGGADQVIRAALYFPGRHRHMLQSATAAGSSPAWSACWMDARERPCLNVWPIFSSIRTYSASRPGLCLPARSRAA